MKRFKKSKGKNENNQTSESEPQTSVDAEAEYENPDAADMPKMESASAHYENIENDLEKPVENQEMKEGAGLHLGAADYNRGYDDIPEKNDADPKRGKGTCCGKFSRCIRRIWATRLTEDNMDKDQYAKTTLRELFTYIFFLVDLSVLTFCMTSDNAYHYTNAMTTLFVKKPVVGSFLTFHDIFTIDDFWKVMKGPVLNGLYWEKWYNDELIGINNSFIYYENLLLGVPRIRQLKVHNASCVVHTDFKDDIESCYGPYAEGAEDHTTIGEQVGTAWKYLTSNELNGSSHWGHMATYSGAGYYVDLSHSSKNSMEILNNLESSKWLDRGTRVVFFDFSTYNANVNLFCIMRLFVEFPATGGALPAFQVYTVKLLRYVTLFDYFLMGCEVLFCLFIFYYTVEEILELRKHKFNYFKGFWNILDIIVVLLSLVAIIFNLYRTVSVDNLLQSLLKDPNLYADFQFLAFWQTQYNNMVAVNVFSAWVKFFKYVSFNKTMTQLSSTLARCAKDVCGFAVMFFIIFFAYAQLGYLIFGTQVKDFSTFGNCIFTQFRIILGDFEFGAIERANRIMGPIYFSTYVFFVFFVLLNMFLAIISDTYSAVKADLAEQEDEFDIAHYLRRAYNKVASKFKIKQYNDIQCTLDASEESMGYEEWHDRLKELGYQESKIYAIFNRFDVDENKILDKNEKLQMKIELNREMNEMNGLTTQAKENKEDDEDDPTEDASAEDVKLYVCSRWKL
uniref:Polycystic kidney disease 2-like 1 n=1 Tax=Eptatretus burgeri TaxID=7764 RepID=A0A8C4WXI3_EPTBU